MVCRCGVIAARTCPAGSNTVRPQPQEHAPGVNGRVCLGVNLKSSDREQRPDEAHGASPVHRFESIPFPGSARPPSPSYYTPG